MEENSHVTLQGDLSESNPKWGATKEYVEKQIDFFFKKEDGTPEGDLEDDAYLFYLPAGNKTDLDAVLSAIFHKNVELDLTETNNIFEEVFDNDYVFIIRNNVGNSLKILINNSVICTIYYTAYMDSYENFSVVSDKLKN